MSDILFEPLSLRGVTLPNRIVLSPMCQYSAHEGFPSDWHFRHYTERAVGGVGLVMLEATAVLPDGRISPSDLGIWGDQHTAELKRLVDALHGHGALVGVQLAHAGRKASTDLPWNGGKPLNFSQGGWSVKSASAKPFDEIYQSPQALDESEIEQIIHAFVLAAGRALKAGFDVIEVHAAHGYLLHQFLSPLSNERKDSWGGSRENRMRLALDIATQLRRIWPEEKPLLTRISATDWAEGGWVVEDSIELAKELKKTGIDLIDVSSGGLVPWAKVQLGPAYQVPFAERIRREAQIPVGGVGLITDVDQARSILETGQTDLIFLGRQLLRDPYWPIRHAPPDARRVPKQYLRAFPA